MILSFHFQFFSQQMKVHLPLIFAIMQFCVTNWTNIASFYESITIAIYGYSELMTCGLVVGYNKKFVFLIRFLTRAESIACALFWFFFSLTVS